jgi:copper transport protein
LKTVPDSGALLDTAPTSIELYFSEGASLEFSTIQLYDRARRQIATGALGRANGDENSVVAPITDPLGPGTYTVVWRVLSSTDGHLTAGTYAFRVKGGSDTAEPIVPNAPADTDIATPSGKGFDNADPFRWIVRALSLAMAIILLGGAMFTVLVIEPTAAEAKGGQAEGRVASAASRRFAMIGTFAGVLLLLLLVADLLMQVAAVNGTGFFGAFGRTDSAALIVQTTRYGFAWLLKALGAVVLAALMLYAWQVQRRNASWVWEIALAAASLLFLAESLGSHEAAISNAGQAGGLPIPIISDWLHLVTAGTWIGGVIYMGAALFPAFRRVGLVGEERRAYLGRLVPRFSRLAVISVVALGVTGTYNLILHSTDLGAILGSAYGQVLAAKIAAYVVLVGLGAMNLRRLTPLLKAKASGAGTEQAEKGGPASRLGRNVRIEMAVGAVALVCAGGLTLLPPPSGTGGTTLASGSPTSVTVASPVPTPGPATTENEVAGYNFKLTTRPSIDGDQLTLDLERTDTKMPPLSDVSKVLFKITPQDIDAGSTSYQATASVRGDDSQTWSATESFLTIDGGYLVTAIVQRTLSPDLKAAFRLDLSEESGLTASPAEVVDVLLATDPSIPVSGTVMLTVTVLDGAHLPIEGANVTINPTMPAHGHLRPLAVAQPVAGQPGVYTIPVQLDMGGSWVLIFTIERDGKPAMKADASIDVIDPNATPTPEEPPGVTPTVSP